MLYWVYLFVEMLYIRVYVFQRKVLTKGVSPLCAPGASEPSTPSVRIWLSHEYAEENNALLSDQSQSLYYSKLTLCFNI